MYHLLYGFLYAVSLFPWRVLYFLSDVAYTILYYVVGYRKDVVMKNLLIAFPEKSEQERVRIAKDFYHGFLDTFIETIKFLSISDKQFSRRITGNFDLLNELYKTGQNIQIHSAHFFNWEYMNWAIPKLSTYPFVGVYLPIENKAFNKIILDMRQRYHSIMVSTVNFKTSFHQIAKGRYALGLYTDQNPPFPAQSFWIPFFGKLTPFLPGPEKSARINNTAIVFVQYYKVKRGYYHAEFELLTTTPQEFGRGQLTKKYVAYLEDCLRKRPSNYLWSHRRWKHEFNEEYRKMVV
jgi:KDO2-lipid IV(A) lauroyltransferase